ncbi:hypothetical protein Tco_1113651 [Tanacetum coccineum]|uniref:Uncharacterized protein n=1 Tax=Tanacetum coccineum TaxID=301880 RepID=A0ABQ5IVH6_9ASTR
MMVQAQEEMGEGLANHTDPHHTPTIIQPSTSQPQKKQNPRKPKRKVTKVPQPSGPTDNVVDEAVYEEMDNRVNTPRSDEDSLKLKELMELCTNLQNRVIDLEKTKTSQAQEIRSLKRSVKRLEKKNRSITHGLKRLNKVCLSARIESSKDKGLGEEDASKQGRIDDTDTNEDIYLVNVHRDKDMFRVNDLEGDEVIVETKVDHEVIVETEVASKDVNLSVDEVTLAQALAALKSAKPKADKVMLQEPEHGTITTMTAATTITAASTRPKAKGLVILEEKQATTPTVSSQQHQLVKFGQGWKPKILKNKSFANIQELFDKAFKRVNTFVDYGTTLMEESSKKAEVIEESSKKPKAEMAQESNDGADVTINATPLSTKYPTIMLKNINREDLDVLWSIVKARFQKTEPVNYMDNFLLLNLKTMFQHHVEDSVWKNQQGLVKVLNWKLYDSCGVHCVTMQSILYYLLVKIYPHTNHTLHQMLNDVKLQVDYEFKMDFELL